jgi:hypothetical protein
MIRELCVLLLLGCAALPAHALRCNSRIVEQGDHAFQVQQRCGEPFWIDRYSEWLIVGENGPFEQRVERVVEAWYYNFGSNRLMRRLVFRDDRLLREDELGYGFSELGTKCDLDALPLGTSNGEIVARCGQPGSRKQRYGDTIARDGVGNARARIVRIEDWIYDPGSTRDFRLLRLIDGRLSGRETLDR